ncbi:biotin/lipoate--protein ligase family protein [Shimia sp. R9_3]|uniref:biotin/lipoate--protein ligase family protein n=1 Tax=Shimia sp. R9_3 TaxID=2821113 RepID=UPI001AD9BE6B|nr:biotin/lipoate--protein ligase family protein [Shimia sp. R9_3]MBO9399593.1 biotin/lipoate--protein ligase family protein [Shimia sp. R9_3]
MRAAPQFPPIFEGLALSGAADPFAKAQTQAIMGCDAGLVVYNLAADQLRAAIVFAPEVSLSEAMPVLISCAIGFQNALGALAPPEVAVHLEWPGGILVNGARCGQLRVAASTEDANAMPDWIVVGLELPLIPANADTPGDTPDQTALYEEGCVDIPPEDLLSAWVRHTLVWVNRMEEDGLKPLNNEWRGLAHNLGEDVSWSIGDTVETGTFVGTDEHFGAMLRSDEDTRLLPLTTLLEGNT